MPTYSLLIQPSFNRVYTRTTPSVGAAEVRSISTLLLDDRIQEVRAVERGGVAYLTFETEAPLTARDLQILVNLSVTFVLFEDHDGLLAPVEVAPFAAFDDDLVTTLRYVGKTNEQFTQLLVNLALAAATGAMDTRLAGGQVRLLDPMCGRGTTLNQALMYGLDAAGIEVDRKDYETYTAFVKKWLQQHRIKHSTDSSNMRKSPDQKARRSTITITRNPDQGGRAETGPSRQVVDYVSDDTINVRDHFTRSSIDLIVTDLPYGVQHAARTNEWGRSRSAEALLETALPLWRQVLRGGGSIALGWNVHHIKRAAMNDLLTGAGFDLVGITEDDRFAHRVDRSITRDVVLARKPES